MPTGFSHPRCYANSLRDCSREITREHYISKALLEATGGKPEIAGLKFQGDPHTLQGLGVEAMTAKILCERHNQALSPLDTEAARLFGVLRDFDQDLRDAAESKTAEVIVDGDKVERWMLKLLAGLVSGKLVNVSELRRGSPWLQILFAEEDWPSDWGFHFIASSEQFFAFDGLEVETRVAGDELWAAIATTNVGSETRRDPSDARTLYLYRRPSS